MRLRCGRCRHGRFGQRHAHAAGGGLGQCLPAYAPPADSQSFSPGLKHQQAAFKVGCAPGDMMTGPCDAESVHGLTPFSAPHGKGHRQDAVPRCPAASRAGDGPEAAGAVEVASGAQAAGAYGGRVPDGSTGRRCFRLLVCRISCPVFRGLGCINRQITAVCRGSRCCPGVVFLLLRLRCLCGFHTRGCRGQSVHLQSAHLQSVRLQPGRWQSGRGQPCHASPCRAGAVTCCRIHG